MIYLIIDTNIWLDFIDEVELENNSIESIEHWLKMQEITILLPEIINLEYTRNKAKNIEDIKKKLHNYLVARKEKKLLDDFSSSLESHIERIENVLFKQTTIIKITNNHKIKGCDLALDKKKPFDNKNSMGDALIYLSMIEYIEQNTLKNCFFITNNYSDFSKSKSEKEKIHNDFELTFSSLGIIYVYGFNNFLYNCDHKLSDIKKIKELKNIEENTLLPSSSSQPPKDYLADLQNSFIENTTTLDLFINKNQPTKSQVEFALNLISLDESYKRYFFGKIQSGFWLKILKENGFFNPEYNPKAPIQVNEGLKTPVWLPLIYLDRLSSTIEGEKKDLFTEQIIEIILNISKHPNNNERTWYFVIKILTNIPTDKIPISLLDFIPNWLDSYFDSSMQSSELCEKLLPKFLNDNPTTEDIKKAEVVLKNLFSIKIHESLNDNLTPNRRVRFYSKIDMYFLKDAMINRKLTSKIAFYCSDEIILFLANSLKKILLNFSSEINKNIFVDNNEYMVKATIVSESLNIFITNKSAISSDIKSISISNYESDNFAETKNKLVKELLELNSQYKNIEPNESNLNELTDELVNGTECILKTYPLNDLSDNDHQYTLEEEVVFALILKDVLIEKVKCHPDKAILLLKEFACTNFYRIPFFRKIVFFVISENWEATKILFWEMLRDNDTHHYFSNNNYDYELKYTLNKIQKYLTADEIGLLKTIIENGPFIDANNRSINPKRWQLYWYSALTEIDIFKNNFAMLSKELDVNFQNEKDKPESVTKKPFVLISADELLLKNNEDILAYIQDFNPNAQTDKRVIDEFGKTLGEAIKKEPQRFSDEMTMFVNVHNICLFHILYAFTEALKAQKIFNLQKVFGFCNECIANKIISSNLQSSESTSSDLTIKSLTGLLFEWMQSIPNKLDFNLLPEAKKIILNLARDIKPVEDFSLKNISVPYYSLSSTAGFIIRALIDYTILKAKNDKAKNGISIWEDDVKLNYEDMFEKGIIDSYIITGWYFNQLWYLDKDWLIKILNKIYKSEDRLWLAFLRGYVIGVPNTTKEKFDIIYPHFKKAIEKNIDHKDFHNNGIIRFIIHFYFSSYSESNSENLILLLIKNLNPKQNLDLINLIVQQNNKYKALEIKDKNVFEEKILIIWSNLAEKYKDIQSPDEQMVIRKLHMFICFTPILNETYTKLIVLSAKIFKDTNFHFNNFIEKLKNLKSIGEPKITVKFLSQILDSIIYPVGMTQEECQSMIQLTTFLYENEQVLIANNLCNKIAMLGEKCLVDIYNKYKA